MVNFHAQCDCILDPLEDTPLGTSVRVFPERFSMRGKTNSKHGTSIPWARVLG